MYQNENIMYTLTKKFIDNIQSCVQAYVLYTGLFVMARVKTVYLPIKRSLVKKKIAYLSSMKPLKNEKNSLYVMC